MKFYRCPHCGSIVAKLNEVGCAPSCCGDPMLEMKANTGDGAFEKHVPAVERKGNRILVQVGSVIHPMLENHYIEWICLATENGFRLVNLHPGEEPKAEFELGKDEKPIGVYAYCNLHGLYLAKVD